MDGWSRPVPSMNLFVYRFVNAFSTPFTASRQTRSSALKTLSAKLVVRLGKILHKRRKEPIETESNHRAAHGQDREGPNVGSTECAPTQIPLMTGSNRVSADCSTRGSGFCFSSVFREPVPYTVVLILVIVSVLLGVSWRFSNRSGAKSPVRSRTGWGLRAIPLVLTLVLHCLSASEISKIKAQIYPPDADHSSSSKERSSLNKGSFTPWALAALIFFLLVMSHYQSKIRIGLFV